MWQQGHHGSFLIVVVQWQNSICPIAAVKNYGYVHVTFTLNVCVVELTDKLHGFCSNICKKKGSPSIACIFIDCED